MVAGTFIKWGILTKGDHTKAWTSRLEVQLITTSTRGSCVLTILIYNTGQVKDGKAAYGGILIRAIQPLGSSTADDDEENDDDEEEEAKEKKKGKRKVIKLGKSSSDGALIEGIKLGPSSMEFACRLPSCLTCCMCA